MKDAVFRAYPSPVSYPNLYEWGPSIPYIWNSTLSFPFRLAANGKLADSIPAAPPPLLMLPMSCDWETNKWCQCKLKKKKKRQTALAVPLPRCGKRIGKVPWKLKHFCLHALRVFLPCRVQLKIWVTTTDVDDLRSVSHILTESSY